ncbi:MAG: cytochrome P450 [Propionibacteriales bacterium]|nr:cytochrome P450 [Propionibacteriales bacterium]
MSAAPHAAAAPDRATSLPPGPPWPMVVQTFLFGGYRHRWLPTLRRRYGDAVLLRIAPRSRRMVLLARPEHIREVFSGSSTTFHAGEGNAILGPLMGPHSVLLLDEDDHLKVRRQLMPAFNGAALRGYRDLVAGITREQVGGWPVGRHAPIHPRMQAITLEVILRVVFGVTDRARLAALRPLVERVVSVSPLIMVAGFYPPLRNYGPWRRHLEVQERMDDLLYAEIAERRTADSLADRHDVLSRLLTTPESSLTDEELRDQLVTLLLAGHETTATGLAWAFHELARNPAVLASAQRVADERDDAYLGAVAKEALRLHPVIYETARVLTEPAEVAGYRLPAGVTVMPVIGLVHSDEEHHPRPREFRPERFLDPDPPSSHTWFPFGGGVRRCLGAGFSLMESEVILREVLTRFDVRAGTSRPEALKARNVTLAPRRGARVMLTPRRPGRRLR